MALTIVYDAGCPFCQRCRAWVEGQLAIVPCRFVPLTSARARSLMGGRIPGDGRELVVVADDGAFWAGSDAFLMVLWALEDYRGFASLLSARPVRPFAELFFGVVSSSRPLLSSIFGGGARCEEGHCGTSSVASSAYR